MIRHDISSDVSDEILYLIFFQKSGKMSQNLSSAADGLRVKIWPEASLDITLSNIMHQSFDSLPNLCRVGDKCTIFLLLHCPHKCGGDVRDFDMAVQCKT